MRGIRTLAFALPIGIAIGVACAQTVHARQVKAPPGYIIAEVEVTDTALIQEYAAQVPGTLVPFHGEYLIRGKTKSLEGAPPKGIVVIAFESRERAQAWYDSPAYQAIKPIRQAAGTSRIFIAEGVSPNR